MDKVQKHN